MSQDKPLAPPGNAMAGEKPLPASPADIVADWRASKATTAKDVVLPPAINLGREQQMLRYATGTILLILCFICTALTIWLDISPWWRLSLFFPYWLAFVGLFQGSEKVCVLHAARGTCDLGEGTQPIDDTSLVARLRAKAYWIYVKAAFCALFWAVLSAMISPKLFG